MVFDHPAVSRSWLSYRVERDEDEEDAVVIATILHVETMQPGPAGDTAEEWEELTDALAEFLFEHDEIQSVEIVPSNAS